MCKRVRGDPGHWSCLDPTAPPPSGKTSGKTLEKTSGKSLGNLWKNSGKPLENLWKNLWKNLLKNLWKTSKSFSFQFISTVSKRNLGPLSRPHPSSALLPSQSGFENLLSQINQ